MIAFQPTTDQQIPPPPRQVGDARRERRLAMGFALLSLGVFAAAAVLDPYDAAGRPRSHGTHRQLGLPPCGLKTLTGIGCPACGMTTSFALLLHGDPAAAWRVNWAGCLVALLAALTTTWFLLVAAGLPPGRFTTDEVVKAAALTGTALAATRWLGTLLAAGLDAFG
jgi:hypothetical protein